MQSYIEGNQLIVNNMIDSSELSKLLEYIEEAKIKGIDMIELYNIEGEVSGVSFKIKEGV